MSDEKTVFANTKGLSRVDYEVAPFPEDADVEASDDLLIDELPSNVSFDVMAFGGQFTVAAASPLEGKRSTSYQSEVELEAAFIEQLRRQAYEYVRIGSEAELIANLRRQLEALNNMTFSDKEWKRFFRQAIAAETKALWRRLVAFRRIMFSRSIATTAA